MKVTRETTGRYIVRHNSRRWEASRQSTGGWAIGEFWWREGRWALTPDPETFRTLREGKAYIASTAAYRILSPDGQTTPLSPIRP